jgi:hypothetical protein
VTIEVPVRFQRVEVRRVQEDLLVSVIEILSPGNKRPGSAGQRKYLAKRSTLLRSSVNLLEIDLLRAGARPPLETDVPPAPYYITLARIAALPSVSVWPVQLPDSLPPLPVPLLPTDEDVGLELGEAVASVYARGRYDRALRYNRPLPPPPLSPHEAEWISDRLQAPERPA